jgi:hypothetical protein
MKSEDLAPALDVLLGLKTALLAAIATTGAGVAAVLDWISDPDKMLVIIGGFSTLALCLNQLVKTYLDYRRVKMERRHMDAQDALLREQARTEAEKHGCRRRTDPKE